MAGFLVMCAGILGMSAPHPELTVGARTVLSGVVAMVGFAMVVGGITRMELIDERDRGTATAGEQE